MIRVHTFIKYAGTHVQEAEAALEQGHLAMVVDRCSDMAVALTKAMSASLPRINKDLLEMDQKALSKTISDLTETPDEAQRIAQSIHEFRQARGSVDSVTSRVEVEAIFSKAGDIFRTVRSLCIV